MDLSHGLCFLNYFKCLASTCRGQSYGPEALVTIHVTPQQRSIVIEFSLNTISLVSRKRSKSGKVRVRGRKRMKISVVR